MNNMSAEFRIKINKVLVISLLWTLAGMLITVYDYLAIHSQISAGSSYDYNFLKSLLINSVAGHTAAILGGSFIVFFVNDKLRHKPYWVSIVLVGTSVIFIFSFVTALIALIIAPIQSGRPVSDPITRKMIEDFIFNQTSLKNILIWSIIVGLTQFLLHINDKFGQGVLWNIIKGRYHTPREETRIFMFVDLVSSTTIAEKLNNDKYHSLLADFYADITDSIIYNKGEIYQYVGDEVVISWKLEAGIQDNHCLRCYFDMQKTIQSLKEKYMSQYGLVPAFKAGLHYGNVIAGEIGIIKRDITFSGDVLNTTSRIQGKCNDYHVAVLSSDELLDLLSFGKEFQRFPIGDIELKGKETRVALSTLELLPA
jgi:adenylate cyclase